MKFKIFFALVASIGMCAPIFSENSVGIVNFFSCANESKLGKQEQASLESLKNQMNNLLQDAETQLGDLNSKFADSEYMDGLSPEAEEEMKARQAALIDEIKRYQGQFYQVMNQAQMKFSQTVSESVQKASEVIAKDRNLSVVMNKEFCFFTQDILDITDSVITEMDRQFETAQSKP